MKINCLVVDDESLARRLIGEYVSKIPQLQLIGKCNNALEAMEALQEETIDLMFLDIQMPDLSGIDFLKSLTKKPIIIFTTANPNYAIESYALGVMDYLLKPISFERFLKAVNKAVEVIQYKKSGNEDAGDYIVIKAERRLYKVEYHDIIYIEGLSEYVTFHLREGKKLVSFEALKNLEKVLPNNFLRIHRSFIINKKEVKSLYGNMVEMDTAKVPIGKTYKSIIGDIF